MRWIAAVVALAGCERVLELTEVKAGGDGGAGGSHACEVFEHVEAEPFATGIMPASNFSVDASELHAVMIGSTVASGTDAAQLLVRANVGDPWMLDTVRPALPAGLVTPRIGDASHVWGVTESTTLSHVVELTLSGSAWQSMGVYSAASTVRPAVTGVAGRADQTTLAIVLFQIDPAFARLQVMSSPSWMPMPQDGPNGTGYVEAGALSADGLTLVYAVPGVDPGLPSLFVSHRAGQTEGFPAGVRIKIPGGTPDEIDPWIVGDCTKLYFVSAGVVYRAY